LLLLIFAPIFWRSGARASQNIRKYRKKRFPKAVILLYTSLSKIPKT